jgi:hypothetical protein
MDQESTTQVNLRMPVRLLATLREIEKRTRVSPTDCLRQLAEGAASFYEANGWFNFPAKVEPVLLGRLPNIWAFDEKREYQLSGDDVIFVLLAQLGFQDAFASALEAGRFGGPYVFDNHPTHWLVVQSLDGVSFQDGTSLSFEAIPKKTTSRDALVNERIRAPMSGSSFRQIPSDRIKSIPVKSQRDRMMLVAELVKLVRELEKPEKPIWAQVMSGISGMLTLKQNEDRAKLSPGGTKRASQRNTVGLTVTGQTV